LVKLLPSKLSYSRSTMSPLPSSRRSRTSARSRCPSP